MGQTVYVDLLFMINFSMDFLCFFLAAKLFGIKLAIGRALLASAIGGAYSVTALFIKVSKITAFAIDVGMCALMCAICFGVRRKMRSLGFYIIVYLAISMLLGGAMTALFNLINRLDITLPKGSSDGISVWMFAALALISAGITLLGGALFKKRSIQKNALLRIEHKGKSISLEAMTDSGNLLKDPMSGAPCIIVDADAMEGVLSPKICEAARVGDVSCVATLRGEDAKSVRLIPTKTATGDGVLIGVRVDEIAVDRGEGEREVNAIIVLSSIKDSADGNKALIPEGIAI